MSVFYWLIVIILPKGYPNKLGFLHIIGNSITFLLSKLCRCSYLSNIYDIICCPFDYPIRIKAAGAIAFGLCLTNLLAVKLIRSFFILMGFTGLLMIYKII